MFSDPDSRVPERISIGKSNPNVMFNEITTIDKPFDAALGSDRCGIVAT